MDFMGLLLVEDGGEEALDVALDGAEEEALAVALDGAEEEALDGDGLFRHIYLGLDHEAAAKMMNVSR